MYSMVHLRTDLLIWLRSQTYAVKQRTEIYIEKNKNTGDKKKISLVNSVLILSSLSNSDTPWILRVSLMSILFDDTNASQYDLSWVLLSQTQVSAIKVKQFLKEYSTFMLQEKNNTTTPDLPKWKKKQNNYIFNVSFTHGRNRSLGRQIKTSEICVTLNSWTNCFSLLEAWTPPLVLSWQFNTALFVTSIECLPHNVCC